MTIPDTPRAVYPVVSDEPAPARAVGDGEGAHPMPDEPVATASSLEAVAEPRRLLILDDDAVVARVLGRSAERIGVAATWVSNPHEFLRLAAQLRPSHVAIDLSMPVMSGLQVLEALARSGCTASVIVSSGSDLGRMDDALGHARAAGLRVAGALPKPFSLAVLRALLGDGAG